MGPGAMIRLGVNVDHVATLRQARGGVEPDPIAAARVCELAGAHSIVAHLREDRRHIQDKDIRLLRETVETRLNMEMSLASDIVAVALEVRPDQATLVPERREELTTEGGLDVVAEMGRVKEVVARLKEAGISVSLFIDPDPRQVEAAVAVGADAVELHTGAYAEVAGFEAEAGELAKLREAALLVGQTSMSCFAGHGLNYRNVVPVARIPEVVELNIGHSIISRAIIVGLERAVKEMLHLIKEGGREEA